MKAHKPQVYHAFAGDVEIVLEYEYTPPEAPVYNLDSPMCGPGVDADVCIRLAIINGAEFEPDIFATSLQERWIDEILELEDAKAREAMESRHEREYEE